MKQVNGKFVDERFYLIGKKYYPSVTNMLGITYPDGGALTKWRGDIGNEDANRIMNQAGEDGTFIHQAIEDLIAGREIISDDIVKRFDKTRSLKIHKALESFIDFWNEYQPEVIETEYSVADTKLKLAGTIDMKCRLNTDAYQDEWIIDWKSSKSIGPKHKIQLSLYAKMDNVNKMGIVHLGNTTKKGYSFLPLKEEEFARFYKEGLACNKLFQTMYPSAKPKEFDFPDKFKLKSTCQKKKTTQ